MVAEPPPDTDQAPQVRRGFFTDRPDRRILLVVAVVAAAVVAWLVWLGWGSPVETPDNSGLASEATLGSASGSTS